MVDKQVFVKMIPAETLRKGRFRYKKNELQPKIYFIRCVQNVGSFLKPFNKNKKTGNFVPVLIQGGTEKFSTDQTS